jgi:hypothetical protein
MPGERDINGYLACWERRPYNTVLVSAGNGKVFDLDPDVIFNPSDFYWGGGFSVHTNFKFSIHSNTAWVKHEDEVSKDGKGHIQRK